MFNTLVSRPAGVDLAILSSSSTSWSSCCSLICICNIAFRCFISSIQNTAEHVDGAFTRLRGSDPGSRPVVHHCIHPVLTSSSEIPSMCADSLSSTSSSSSWFKFLFVALKPAGIQSTSSCGCLPYIYNVRMQQRYCFQLILEIPEEKTARGGAFHATWTSARATTKRNISPLIFLTGPFIGY